MVYDTVNGKHVYWTDKQGVTHKCEGDDVHDFRLLWTKCGKHDVPANTGYHPALGDKVTCEECLSK